MPTVLRKNGFRFVIYPNDHLPSHIHGIKGGGEVRINLGSKSVTPSLMSVSGDISDKDVAKALSLVRENQSALLAKWGEIHG